MELYSNISDDNRYDKYIGQDSNCSIVWSFYFNGNLHFLTIGQSDVGIFRVITILK